MSSDIDPLSVQCPFCHAGAGHECADHDGTVHINRVLRAQQIYGDVPVDPEIPVLKLDHDTAKPRKSNEELADAWELGRIAGGKRVVEIGPYAAAGEIGSLPPEPLNPYGETRISEAEPRYTKAEWQALEKAERIQSTKAGLQRAMEQQTGIGPDVEVPIVKSGERAMFHIPKADPYRLHNVQIEADQDRTFPADHLPKVNPWVLAQEQPNGSMQSDAVMDTEHFDAIIPEWTPTEEELVKPAPIPAQQREIEYAERLLSFEKELELKRMVENGYTDCRSASKPLAKGPRYVHPGARVTGSTSSDTADYYECSDCGTTWTQELPE